MISQRKLDANRRNTRKSTGPRTGAGKSRSSRNAIRHGLTNAYRDVPSQQILAIVKDLCRDDPFPYRLEYAIRVADAQAEIARIRRARIGLIERFRKVGSPEEERVDAIIRTFTGGNIRKACAMIRRVPHLLGEMLDWVNSGPPRLPPSGAVAEYFSAVAAAGTVRTDAECVLQALPELSRLERYERRALGRRRRALRAFMARRDV